LLPSLTSGPFSFDHHLMTVTRERPFAGAGELTRERTTFRLIRVNRTTFRLLRHNRTRVDEIADQHLKERKQRRQSKLAVC
jgi:hypothetical protein